MSGLVAKRLRFETPLEQEFARDQAELTTQSTRITLIIATTFYALYGIVDVVLTPEIAQRLLLIRLAGYLPMTIVGVGLTYLPNFWRHRAAITIATSAIAALSVSIMAVLSPSLPVKYSNISGIVAVFLVLYAFGRVPFGIASFAGWSVIAIYNAVLAISGQLSGELALATNPILVLSNVIGTFVSYSIEKAARGDFLRRRELAAERERVTRLNLSLERRVVERTNELSDAVRKLDYMARHDALTGLLHRRFLEEEINTQLHRTAGTGEKLALVMMDIDRFKEVNDTIGHNHADRAIQISADRLVRALRSGDRVFRQGGDTFVGVMPDARSPEHVMAIISEALDRMRRRMTIGGFAVELTMSVGVSIVPNDATEFGALLQSADRALYEAKSRGRNQTRFYDPELGAAVSKQARISQLLRTSLDNNEFRLVYQPKIRVMDRTVCGLEALLRWNSRVAGEVSPYSFMRAAEDIGMAHEIGNWVLRRALQEIKPLLDRLDPDFQLNVNMSATHFGLPGMAAGVEAALTESQFPARNLRLELTEGALLADLEHTSAAVTELRALEVSISIDDFGTGYSSLAYLSRLKVDELKIDRSFVSSLHESPQNDAITRSVVALGRALGIEVVAEGVERTDQYETLARYGCDIVQGFLFAAPVPRDCLDPNAQYFVADKRFGGS